VSGAFHPSCSATSYANVLVPGTSGIHN
jgi:hypothetical protein